jgi:hypothetical protein
MVIGGINALLVEEDKRQRKQLPLNSKGNKVNAFLENSKTQFNSTRLIT